MTRWKFTDLATKRPPSNTPPARLAAPEKANAITRNVIRRICNQPGGHAFRVNTTGIWDEKKQVYRTSAGQKGIADVLACVKGRFLAVEVKAGKDRQSTDQKIFQQDIELSGGTYFVVHSTDEFLEKFNHWITSHTL